MNKDCLIKIYNGSCSCLYEGKNYTTYALEIFFKKTKLKKLNKRTGNIVWFSLYTDKVDEAREFLEEDELMNWEVLKESKDCLEFFDTKFLSIDKPLQDLILVDLNRIIK